MTSKVRQVVEILRQVLWETDRWCQMTSKVRQVVEIVRQVVQKTDRW